jgi:hypothetical protein
LDVWTFVIFSVLLLSGCQMLPTAGPMRAEALGDDPVVLYGDFRTSYYSNPPQSAPTFIFADVPLEQVQAGEATNAQIMHVQLLWLPKAGRTPMSPTATNASIRFVVIANGEVGLYSGAGFATPSHGLNRKRVTLTVRDATLQLQESTPGFRDLLSPAQISGRATATLDDRRTVQLHRAASQLVTNALGRTQLVRGD